MSMTIGAVARAAGVGVETIRYYERSGLLEPPPRSPAGYRRYPPETVNRIAAYKRLQRLGFALSEAAELLVLREKPEPCEAVKQRAAAKVAAIEEKVAALMAVKTELLALVARCDDVCTATSCTVLLAPDQCGNIERAQP